MNRDGCLFENEKRVVLKKSHRLGLQEKDFSVSDETRENIITPSVGTDTCMKYIFT
jgi:hypothetical protein